MPPSAVIDFCERHNLTKMLNLLRHSSGNQLLSCMQEVYAVELLEELLASDTGGAKEDLDTLKAQIHPLAKAAKHRADLNQFSAKMEEKNEIIQRLIAENQRLRNQLVGQEEKTSRKKPRAPTPQEEHDSQFPYSQADLDETQPLNAAENYSAMMADGH